MMRTVWFGKVFRMWKDHQEVLSVSIGFSWSIAKSLLAYGYNYGIGVTRWNILGGVAVVLARTC